MSASAWETVRVNGSEMKVYVSVSEAEAPAPAVLVIHGQSGVEDFLEVTRMIARQGYVAAAPDLFHRDGPDCHDDGPTRRARLRDATVIQDVTAAANFLKRHPSVDGARLAIVGFCMGGRIVYLMAAANPDFKAGVMYYGSDTMRPWGDGPAPIERTPEIHCPIMGHFGAEDGNPSPADMHKLDAELSRHGKAHEFHQYPNAGHAFANLGSPKYRAAAADASWPRTFAFFDQHLGTADRTGTELTGARMRW
jgi:carboxymethylenebutenolidase